ncbi:MAG: LuxR C-terminal-related transcriptional regulator [Anaerolineales bacterium]
MMPLVRTKLYIPRGRQELVPRPRLIARLNQGLKTPATLVSGPAGFGKTTLLAEWIRQAEWTPAWISLDEGDNDPVRFLSYLVSALNNVEPGVYQAALEMLQSPQPPPAERVLTAVINAVDQAHLQDDASPYLILILDDYHLITSNAVHAAMTFLLDHLPERMRLVISSRADPPLPLARLRARAQLTELRVDDLRFSLEETADFLNRIMGLNLQSADIRALASRTEGWAAGLQMAAVSLQGRADLGNFIKAFTGSNRYILDYLVEEVLGRQPEHVQSFLMKTSLLKRLNGPLCDVILKEEQKPDHVKQKVSWSGQEILEYLENSNLFIVPLDDQRQWYRYHRLFADLLNKRLNQIHPGLAPVLHKRASHWFECHDLITEAVDHALLAEDWERAVILVEQAAEGLLLHGEIGTLAGWLDRLPVELVRSHALLDLYQVTCLIFSGQSHAEIEAHLERIERQHPQLLAEITVLRAYLALFQAQFSKVEELAREALAGLAERSTFFQSTLFWIQGFSGLNVEDLNTRADLLQTLAEKSKIMGGLMFTVITLCQLAEVRMGQGQLVQARDLYQKALETAIAPDESLLPVAGQAKIGLGHILREWNQLDQAIRYSEQGIELVGKWQPMAALDGYFNLAWSYKALGDAKKAHAAILKAQQMAQAYDVTEIDDRIVAFVQARLDFWRGDLQAIQRYLDEMQTAIPPGEEIQPEFLSQGMRDSLDYRMRKYEQIALARALIVQQQPADALALLDALVTKLREQGRIMMLVEIQILRAEAMHLKGNAEGAQAAFEEALRLAEPGNFMRTFMDEGPWVVKFLQAAISRGVCPDYPGRILDALGIDLPIPPHKPASAPSGLVEALSEREMQVLRLLNSSLSIPEIARELTVAVSTVRTHVKHIYAKLDVHSRLEAVAKAQELDLV